VERVRRWFRVSKVGHTGTLDPFATGLLVLCLGKATRLSHYITSWDKEYEGSIRLGTETDTDDATGIVVFASDRVAVTREKLDELLDRFRGTIQQLPPRFSAKKREGVPSYRLARRGEAVELTPVSVRIHRLEIVSLDLPLVHFRAHCSKGTYMRSLARDLGRALGCGAHLAGLRRTGIGHLRVEEAFTLEEIKARRGQDPGLLLWPVERVLSPWAQVSLTQEGAQKVRYGQDVPEGVLHTDGAVSIQMGECVRLVGESGEFLAIGKVIQGSPSLVIHPEQVWAERQ
jgi:tRNA pseudouridine55 synthase